MFESDRLKRIVETSSLSYKQNAISFIFTCPRCGKKDKLYVRKRDGVFCCFFCTSTEYRFSGKAEYALTELLGISLKEVKTLLYNFNFLEDETEEKFLDLHFNEFEENEVETASVGLPEVDWELDTYQLGHPLFAKGLRYLLGRGVTEDLIKYYDIRYNTATKRVVFPIKVSGKLIGWQGRYINQTSIYLEDGKNIKIPKIITSTDVNKAKCLMFQDNLKGSSHAVLTEGPVDAVKAHLCGGNVASMGKGVSREQLDIIVKSGVKRLYIGLDDDAVDDILRITKELSDMELYRLKTPNNKKDLGDCTLEEVYESFCTAAKVSSSTLFIYLRKPAGYFGDNQSN